MHLKCIVLNTDARVEEISKLNAFSKLYTFVYIFRVYSASFRQVLKQVPCEFFFLISSPVRLLFFISILFDIVFSIECSIRIHIYIHARCECVEWKVISCTHLNALTKEIIFGCLAYSVMNVLRYINGENHSIPLHPHLIDGKVNDGYSNSYRLILWFSAN